MSFVEHILPDTQVHYIVKVLIMYNAAVANLSYAYGMDYRDIIL